MAKHRVWLLRLVLPGRYGRVLTAMLLLMVLLPFFALGTVKGGDNNPPALFYALILAYIIPVFSFITARASDALDDLRPILNMDAVAFAERKASLDSLSPRESFLWLLLAAIFGLCHMSFVKGSVSAAILSTFETLPGFLVSIGAVLVWIVMTTVIVKLIQQAMVFSDLGARQVQASLVNFESLLPFGRVAISASLAVIGALALFPLISIEDGLQLAESVPGAVATLVPLMVIFIIPVWPLHHRLRRLKQAEISRVNAEISRLPGATSPGLPSPSVLQHLGPLLVYRREISRTPTWPFDLGNVTRLLFYLIIIPLTWIGAALIENVVDAFL